MELFLKKSRNWRLVLTVLAFLLVFQSVGLARAVNVVQAESADSAASLSKALEGASGYLQKADATDWSVFALARSGSSVPAGYLDALEGKLKQVNGKLDSATDYERTVLIVKSLGGDPTSFGGYNLIEAIYNHPDLTKKGTMGAIFGLLALNSGEYTIPSTAVNTAESLISWLLKSQAAGKGWAYVADEPSSIDVTAMALSALAPYYEKQPDVKKAVDQAVAWLSSQQKASGGFSDMGENSDSAAQVIIALTSLGMDPQGASFTKNKGLVDYLYTYLQKDGGFAHSIGAASNQMSTEQALQALTAYQLFTAKKGTLYYHIQAQEEALVRVEGPQSTVSSGTVKASNALEALQALAEQKNLKLDVVDSAYGKYISGVQDIKASGNDGWMFSVLRGNDWIYPQVGMGDFALQKGDQVIVYYGGATQVIRNITVNPAQPKVNQPFTVHVEKSTWDWEQSKEVTSAAAGVSVQIGDQKQDTNEKGEALFKGIASEGPITAIVTGYQKDAAPSVVKAEQSFKVESANVNIRLDVEGDKAHLLGGVVTATNALNALEQLTTKNNIALEVKEFSFGKLVSGIGETKATETEGWMFAVYRDGEWVYPDLGMGEYALRNHDQVKIYYGFNAQLIHSVSFTPESPRSGEPFLIQVTQETWDWTNNKLAVTPAAGVSVELGGKTYVTEEDGSVNVPAGLSNGNYTAIITGYQNEAAPSVVRYEQPLPIYADWDQAADWAKPYIALSGKLGLLNGVGEEGYAPAKYVTRAEVAATLVRLLNLPVPEKANNSFTDVADGSWYAGYITTVKEQGIVEGVDKGIFSPNQTITREQLALMLTRGLGLPSSDAKPSKFKDLNKAASTSVYALEAVVQAGIMNGTDDTHFAPQSPVTREMLAAVVVRAYEALH
ncbi:S-layer homology domain-containing protein [Paenibacillus eucommiae]|uniref:Prenyltransferase beta subunit n=1 Tax=Paenibacillus eucommiae TaxID=1355755 RepID=A0ABS4INI3_9BACL|nr:S-layer homology domain-containing protein [Paenibacillus eucommiae]MBP1989124.1 prenyltransferase beta subunit [Paenibacillus eucommiae]